MTSAKRKGSDPKVPLFQDYSPLPGSYDEVFQSDGTPRPSVAPVVNMLDELGRGVFKVRKRLAEKTMLRGGITFTVYGAKAGMERVFPFDLIPRLISAQEWAQTEAGLAQRVRALNHFLQDVYGEQRILRDGVIPREVVESSSGYLPKLRGITPPRGVFVHIAGVDLIRDADGSFLVLEDNLRSPSGVSYVIENRAIMKRALTGVFSSAHVRSVDAYPTRLLNSLLQCAPVPPEEARLVVLTPGPFNSAYFEHSFLARRMGCDLVVPSDLFVQDERVFVKTTEGPLPVHVIYRRIDDDFIDPEVFNPESLLGISGLVRAYQAGNVTIANALGNGVADDKAVYPYVPDMIGFYLSEQPLLAQVPTLLCHRENDCQAVLEHPERYVIKSVDASGGYGLLMGPTASQKELSDIRDKIRELPRGFIAQPLVELSTCPTWTGSRVEPRRVDLRPFVLTGNDVWSLPGGLTRVALKAGSYVVNSSQGGGSKDTWIIEAAGAAGGNS